MCSELRAKHMYNDIITIQLDLVQVLVMSNHFIKKMEFGPHVCHVIHIIDERYFLQ